jgi:pimeloyl-ACP methyl ester carboxylesterase
MPEISTRVSSSLYYRKMGNGPAVVLLHGFPESGQLWANVWDKLSETNTLIIPDFPGAGSSELENSTSMVDMAECVADILDAEHIEKAVIVGHSMGGYAALQFAFSHPHRVAGVSLVHSTPVADDDEKRNTRLKSIELIRKGGKRAFISQMIPNLFSTLSREKLSSLIENLVDDGVNMKEASLINFYEAMIGRKDLSDFIHSASFPVQWIMGAGDNLMPASKLIGHCYRSDVNFVSLYGDCGHMSMFEAPERLTADLLQFIRYCS